MPTLLPTAADEVAGLSYSYKPSLVGAPSQFDLTDDGLSWRVSGKSGVWPYATLAAIRLSYRPITMQPHRFRADVRNANGQLISIISVSWRAAALVASQDESYRSFILQLHRRIADVGGRPTLSAGLKRLVYGIGTVAVALVGVALAGLILRALLIGSYSGLLFLAGFAALFGWQIGRFLKRNKPRAYTLDNVPRDVIP